MTEQALATDPKRPTDSPVPPDAARWTWAAALLREPLLHFLLLGALLFGCHAWFQQRQAVSPQTLVVSAGTIEHLATIFTKTWQRPPTRDELQGLIDDHLREEVAYREGQRLGLEQNDTIIRRRIRQKLDFFAEDFADLAEPSDADLEAYLASHAAAYAGDSRCWFRQVFIDPAKHAEGAEAAVAGLLEKLQADPAGDASELGDRTLLEHVNAGLTTAEIANLFGPDFADQLGQLAAGQWQGPVRSGYGLHIVIVDRCEPGQPGALADVRDAVRRDWEHQQRKELVEKFYRGLLDQYQIQIEWPTAAEQDP